MVRVRCGWSEGVWGRWSRVDNQGWGTCCSREDNGVLMIHFFGENGAKNLDLNALCLADVVGQGWVLKGGVPAAAG